MNEALKKLNISNYVLTRQDIVATVVVNNFHNILLSDLFNKTAQELEQLYHDFHIVGTINTLFEHGPTRTIDQEIDHCPRLYVRPRIGHDRSSILSSLSLSLVAL